jgi:hypothetical protein
MKIYKCVQRFFCQPLKRYIPVDALVARYENAVRIVIQDAPQSDQDVYNTLVDGFVYDSPSDVTWFYHIEPPLAAFFVLVGTKDEDAYGNVSGTADGLPVNSTLKVVSNIAYLKNTTTSKWHSISVSGPDGNVTLDIEQVGVVF